MAPEGLTEAWRGAMAAKPSDWTLRGVVCGPAPTMADRLAARMDAVLGA